MRTGLGKWAEAVRNIRIGDEVKEEGRDYFGCWPEGMDWNGVGQGILQYGRWREIVLGLGMRWWHIGPVKESMLWIKVQFKGINNDNRES